METIRRITGDAGSLEMILRLFNKKEKKIESLLLDERVGDLLEKALDNAENLFYSDPVKGLYYLRHANELYHKREEELGVDIDRLCRLNLVFRQYIGLCVGSQEGDYHAIS